MMFVWLTCLFDMAASFGVMSRIVSNMDSRFVKESEFKHARVALLAVPTLGFMSTVGDIDEPVLWLSSQPVETQVSFFSLAGLLETTSLSRLDKGFSLKSSLVPGNYFSNKTLNADLELASGRAAMLIAAGLLANGAMSSA